MRTQLAAFFLLISYVQCALPRGYVVNKSLCAAYRLVYNSRAWPDANEHCKDEGGHLAVPRSEEEFNFLQKLVRAMHYPSVSDTDNKLVVWLGITNIEDYKIWKNLYGEDITTTGFHKWAGENGQSYSDDPSEPHCAAMDPANPGLRDYWCHRRQPYLCQIDLQT
ncbi:unnamed protein product [Colias eurytheme]|nr:unnamed protein product [Colias eurytheme]